MASHIPALHGLPSILTMVPNPAVTVELGNQLASYFGMAATCLLAYDMITTFDKEIHFFWKRSHGHFTTWVFFLNRYIGFYAALINTIYFLNAHLPFADQPVADSKLLTIVIAVRVMLLFSPAHVKRSNQNGSGAFGAWSHQVAGWFGIVLIDCILLIRVLALCPGDRKLARVLMALFAAESIASFGLLIHIEVAYNPGNHHIMDRVYCGIRGVFDKQAATAYWILPLIFELVLLAVATYKTITYWGSLRNLSRYKLASILLRDQVIYFVIVMACSVGSITVYWIDDSNFQAVVSGFANASLPCVLGSHLLFNLKEAGQKGDYGTTDRGTVTVSNGELRFNPKPNPPSSTIPSSTGSTA